MEEQVTQAFATELAKWVGTHTGAFIRFGEVAQAVGAQPSNDSPIAWFLNHAGAFVSTEEALTFGEKLIHAIFGGN